MQPNEKVHIYTEDDLIGNLTEWFELMIDIEKEMEELAALSIEYPNFKNKCSEFGELWEGISDLVDMAIDNLQHFASFKHISTMKEEKDKAFKLFRSFSLHEK